MDSAKLKELEALHAAAGTGGRSDVDHFADKLMAAAPELFAAAKERDELKRTVDEAGHICSQHRREKDAAINRAKSAERRLEALERAMKEWENAALRTANEAMACILNLCVEGTDWTFAQVPDEIAALRAQLAEAQKDAERFVNTLITMRKALVLNGTRLTDDAINAYEELKLTVAIDAAKEKP